MDRVVVGVQVVAAGLQAVEVVSLVVVEALVVEGVAEDGD